MRAILALPFLAASLSAQAPPPAPEPLPPAQQVVAAVAPLPVEFRDSATVLGYRAGSAHLVMLRESRGPFICLADNPALPQFHVACYHRSLEPFMARGRELRASGVKGDTVDIIRNREVESGKVPMPKTPAALYTLTGPANAFDPATGTVTGARPLFVIYISGATPASTGLTATPAEGTPWIMFPGTPKAHIMLVPRM